MSAERYIPLHGRRQFIIGLGALAAMPTGCSDDPPREIWVSAEGDDDDGYGIVAAGPDGVIATVESGFRGHAVAQRPDDPRRVIMFGRRPGMYGIDVDVVRGRIVGRFECAPDRRLQGHGCFTPDGALLLTAEADVETGQGKIGVRDAATFETVRELDTGGIGPHEIGLMPDGETLVVANGGILTRPETGAEKLNLDTMSSSLTYLDLATGERVAEERVPEQKASIRHLSICADGTVVVAMQVQREALDHEEIVPLAAVHAPGGALEVLDDGLDLVSVLEDYAGSIAVNERSRTAAVTSPRGNLVAFWNIDSGKLVGHHAFDDVCGVAISGDERHFVLSGSGGQVRVVDASTLVESRDARERFDGIRWDNHMITIVS